MGYLNIGVGLGKYKFYLEYELNKRFSFNTYLDEKGRCEHIFIRELRNFSEFEIIYVIDYFYNEVRIEFFILNLSFSYPVNLSIEKAKENFRPRHGRIVYKGQTISQGE